MQKTKLSLSFLLGLISLAAAPALASGVLLRTPVKGEYVYETHMPSAAAATDKAQAYCRGRYGGGCSMIKTWDHGCLAIAHSNSTNRSGWAISGSMGSSMAKARTICEKNGDSCSFSSKFETNNCE